MFSRLIIIFSFSINCSLFAGETEQIEILKNSQQEVFQSKLECENTLITGSFQNCWLKLFHTGKQVKNADIFINGGMPKHQHGLPTSPKVIWSSDKNAHLIKGLKFSMPGEWLLTFKVSSSDLAIKDQIEIAIEVN